MSFVLSKIDLKGMSLRYLEVFCKFLALRYWMHLIQVLSDISKLYDLLGLISSVTLLGKVFLQKLWSSKVLNWDEHLSSSLCEEWKGLVQTWQNLHTLRIPRYVGQIYIPITDILRCFSYLRILNQESKFGLF